MQASHWTCFEIKCHFNNCAITICFSPLAIAGVVHSKGGRAPSGSRLPAWAVSRCLGGVSVVSRWYLGGVAGVYGVLFVSQWCLDDCLGGVSVVSRWCLGSLSVVSCWLLLISCWSRAGFLLVSCWPHAGFLLVSGWSLACLLPVSCWSLAGFLLVSCCSPRVKGSLRTTFWIT